MHQKDLDVVRLEATLYYSCGVVVWGIHYDGGKTPTGEHKSIINTNLIQAY